MSKPVAVYYDMMSYESENLIKLARAFELIRLPDPRADTDDILKTAAVCAAPLGFEFDAAKMDRCPNLKAILSNTTGVPHIDMDAAADRGIVVCSLKDEQVFLDTITPTAEHAWGLLLAVTRRVPLAHRTVTVDGRWNRFDLGGAAMLSRLKLGIVGLGRLGRMVAGYARAFRMEARYYDPHVTDKDVLGDGVIAEPMDDLVELARWCDVLTLHAPALPETRGLISGEVIGALKSTAVLINTARGELVDEHALLAALETGRLAGAALDVLDGEYAPEFDPTTHPLVRYAANNDNLVLTPHIGGSTRDAWRETQGRVVDMATGLFGPLDDEDAT